MHVFRFYSRDSFFPGHKLRELYCADLTFLTISADICNAWHIDPLYITYLLIWGDCVGKGGRYFYAIYEWLQIYNNGGSSRWGRLAHCCCRPPRLEAKQKVTTLFIFQFPRTLLSRILMGMSVQIRRGHNELARKTTVPASDSAAASWLSASNSWELVESKSKLRLTE